MDSACNLTFVMPLCKTSLVIHCHMKDVCLRFGYYLLKMDSNAIRKAPMPRRSVGNAVCLQFTMH